MQAALGWLSSIPAPLNGALQAAYRLHSSSSAPRAIQTTTLTASATSIAGVILVPPGALSPLLLFLLFYLALPSSNGNSNPTWLTRAGASQCPGRARLVVWGGKSRAGPLVTSSTSSTLASRGEYRHQIMVWDVVTVQSGYLTHKLIRFTKIRGWEDERSLAALPRTAA